MTTLLQRERGKAWKNKKSSETRKKTHYSWWFLAKKCHSHSGKWREAILQERLGSALNPSLSVSMNLGHDSTGNSSLISSFPQSWCVALAAPAPGRGIWGGSALLCSAWGMVRGSSIVPGLWLHQAKPHGLQEFSSALFPLHSSDGQRVRKRTFSY